MFGNFKEKANAYFKDTQPIQEGAQAMVQYEIEAHAVRVKIARLSVLRLAKHATEMDTAVELISKSAKASL